MQIHLNLEKFTEKEMAEVTAYLYESQPIQYFFSNFSTKTFDIIFN